jgi:Rod binding domain-containing protein
VGDVKSIKLQNDPLLLHPRAERIMQEQQERAAAKELAAHGGATAKTAGESNQELNILDSPESFLHNRKGVRPSGAPAARDSRDPKMLEAARSFENQFIRQMIVEMRKTVPKDELLGESMTESVFRDQLDGEYADSWVNKGGIGLADMIYDQLYEKYGNATTLQRKGPSEVLPLSKNHGSNIIEGQGVRAQGSAGPAGAGQPARAGDRPRDILTAADKNLFLAKRGQGGFVLKSREPLPEAVGLRSPLSGVVLQAAALEDGRQMVVVKHDQGLISQFVHTGRNRVTINNRVDAGQVIAELPPSQNGEVAKVFFGLRPAESPAHVAGR